MSSMFARLLASGEILFVEIMREYVYLYKRGKGFRSHSNDKELESKPLFPQTSGLGDKPILQMCHLGLDTHAALNQRSD